MYSHAEQATIMFYVVWAWYDKLDSFHFQHIQM